MSYCKVNAILCECEVKYSRECQCLCLKCLHSKDELSEGNLYLLERFIHKEFCSDATCWWSCIQKTAAFKNGELKHDSYGMRRVGKGVRKAFRQLWSRCIERIGRTKAGSIVGSAREIANWF